MMLLRQFSYAIKNHLGSNIGTSMDHSVSVLCVTSRDVIVTSLLWLSVFVRILSTQDFYVIKLFMEIMIAELVRISSVPK